MSSNRASRKAMRNMAMNGLSPLLRLRAMQSHIVRTTKHYQVTESKTVDRYNGVETCDIKRTITKRPF